jgi:K+-sensing histidine kinase KdpD
MNKHYHVMVCVTGQRTCERLIRHSAAFAQTLDCPVSVVHVADDTSPFLGVGDTAGALEYLYRISAHFGADMTILRSTDVVGTLADFAKKNHITHIVLGGPAATGVWEFPGKLRQALPGVEQCIIPSDAMAAAAAAQALPLTPQVQL